MYPQIAKALSEFKYGNDWQVCVDEFIIERAMSLKDSFTFIVCYDNEYFDIITDMKFNVNYCQPSRQEV